MFLSNPAVTSSEAYTPGLTREFVAQKYAVPLEDVAKLGSAENPLGPSPLAKAAVEAALEGIDIYPDWTAAPLREKIAQTYDVAPDQVVCGAGETEIISWIIRTFAEPGGKLLMHEPTFPIYHLFAVAEGRVPVFVPMGADFDFRLERFIESIAGDVRIVFLTRPHSPTGKLLDDSAVRRVCRAAGERLVVLDEAYIHFSETEGGIPLVGEFDNLIVLRTFSKAYGLAGLRIGFGITRPHIARPMLAVKPTWNMGRLQVAAGIAALDDHAHVSRTVAMVREMRDYVAARIGALNGFRMVEGSRSNFFLLEILDTTLDSTKVFTGLLQRGVIVKDCSVSFRGLGHRYLRVDVSLRKNMDRLLDALSDLEPADRRRGSRDHAGHRSTWPASQNPTT